MWNIQNQSFIYTNIYNKSQQVALYLNQFLEKHHQHHNVLSVYSPYTYLNPYGETREHIAHTTTNNHREETLAS